MALFGLAPYRCRACWNRFFRIPIGNGNGAQPLMVQHVPVAPVIPQAFAPSLSTPPGAALHPLAQIPIAFSILIVSQDPAIRKLLCKVLAGSGYHTHELGDTAQISSELQSRKVDLLITDLEIPEQQGLEAVAALRSRHPKLRIIALSGLRIPGVPGSIVLPKPVPRELLLESVQTALAEVVTPRP